MDSWNCKHKKLWGCYMNSVTCKCVALVVIVLFIRSALFPAVPGDHGGFDLKSNLEIMENHHPFSLRSGYGGGTGVRIDKFLEVPQIVWGLNNQKIAFARACLTARLLNRTLLMPSLSASLFYKDIDKLQPIEFDKVFKFERFNSLCNGFVQLGRYSDLLNASNVVELQKGSGRRWTPERDLDQLMQFSKDSYDSYEVIRILGKNPFMWQDHWPVKDYARVFECLVLVDEIQQEAEKVISKIHEVGRAARDQKSSFEKTDTEAIPYVAVHMRIEIDWMIHCKNMEQRYNINEICSGKEQIIDRVGNIDNLSDPTVVYLAVADSLLKDDSILSGWKQGLLPYEKKRLGVKEIYDHQPYLIKSAIDYEVCSRADVFVGNTFSTFSNLVVLERTQRIKKHMGSVESGCSTNVKWPSYAYNLLGENGGPRIWMTNMSDTSLHAISYGSNQVAC